LTGDGHLDLAVADYQSADVQVLTGDGHGNFTPGTPIDLMGSQPLALVAGDFEGDGRLDLAVATYDPNTFSAAVQLLQNQGSGTFTPAAAYPAGASIGDLAVGDFNGDRHPDLVTANDTDLSYPYLPANSVTLLLGHGDGTFTSAAPVPAGTFPDALAVGDFNGDGRPDLAAADGNVATVTALLGDGSGGLLSPVLAPS